jgi:hypothetical protein
VAISTVGQLVLTLRQQAEEEGRLREPDPTNEEDTLAVQVLSGMRVEGKPKSEGTLIGSELRSGRVNHPKAKAIRYAASQRLRDYTTFLRAADELGYTPEVLRAALLYHYDHLSGEHIGSDGHCILMDIQQFVADCDERTRQVVAVLANGYGPQGVGTALGVQNGSRLVARTLRLLSKKAGGNR